jgi:hypothetical protein
LSSEAAPRCDSSLQYGQPSGNQVLPGFLSGSTSRESTDWPHARGTPARPSAGAKKCHPCSRSEVSPRTRLHTSSTRRSRPDPLVWGELSSDRDRIRWRGLTRYGTRVTALSRALVVAERESQDPDGDPT